MEQAPKTSFIPKQAMGSKPRLRRQRSFGVLNVLATTLFMLTLTAAVGIFFYDRYTDAKLSVQKQELESMRSSFRQEDIDSIRNLDRKLRAVKMLLDQHLSLSLLFDALEARTLTAAYFSDFEFTRLPSGDATLMVGGKAFRFNTVALQEREFSEERLFDSVTFYDLNTINEVGVQFNVLAEVDEGAMRYSVLFPEAVGVPLSLPESAVLPETFEGDGEVTNEQVAP